ncbi:MAG: YqhA family protein [Mariprofundaceae bacterium]
MLERIFESILWNSRFVVILAVLSSLVGAFILFALATLDIIHLFGSFVSYAAGTHEGKDFHVEAMGAIITSVDVFLLGTVLLIFALGLYELFISKIEAAENSNVLLINSLDDLKDRLGKVVMMILVVVFFKHVLNVSFDNPLNILYMGGGILMVSLALYFTHKGGKEH